MSFNFLLTKDLTESSILKSVLGDINMDSTLQNEFLFQTNEWYLEECLELGVDESEIMTYNPNTDTADLRNRSMVQLATYHYLKQVFFSEWGAKEDIFQLKLPIAQREFDNLLGKMNKTRIKGERPAIIKTQSSFASITRRRG